MITTNQVWQIMNKLFPENASMPYNEIIDDISCIIYRNDIFECGDKTIHSKHIDIEFSFGECYEIPQDNPVFQFICNICNFPLSEETQELIIYQK